MKATTVRYWIGSIGIALVLALVCFGGGLHARMFGDDFLYQVHAVAANPFWFFNHANPLHIYAFRPLEFALIWMTQDLLPADTILLHASQLALHLAVAVAISLILTKIGFGRGVSMIAGLFFLVSQSTVHAVVSNDTVSQQFETLFGCASLYFLHSSVSEKGRVKFRHLGLSVALFVFALLGKELGMSLVATFGLYLAYRTFRGEMRSREALIAFLPHLVVGLLYMAFRKHVGLPSGGFGERAVDFHIGANLLVNPFLALAQVAMPFASVDVFLALKAKDFASLLLPALGAALVLGLPTLGLYLTGRLRTGVEFAGLFFSSICIAFLMNHISELYVYSALPFFATFFAIGMDGLRRNLAGPKKVAVIALVAVVLVVNIFACRSKTSLMAALGERATMLRPQVERIMADAPKNAKIALVNPVREATYSVYRQEGFISISDLAHAWGVMHKREDLEVTIFAHSPDGIRPDPMVSYYTYDRDLNVIPYVSR